jgi:hypothetical protein
MAGPADTDQLSCRYLQSILCLQTIVDLQAALEWRREQSGYYGTLTMLLRYE